MHICSHMQILNISLWLFFNKVHITVKMHLTNYHYIMYDFNLENIYLLEMFNMLENIIYILFTHLCKLIIVILF